jgi:hypothetical protein
MSGSLAPVMVVCTAQYLCSALRSDAIPGGDATGQDALGGAAVELFEDLGTYAKSFQSLEGEKVLSSLLHDYLGVFGP